MLKTCALTLAAVMALPLAAFAQTQTSAPTQMDATPASIAISKGGSTENSFKGGEPPTLARDLQNELKRLGCLGGDVDGVWGDGSKKALKDFARHAKVSVAGDEPTTELLEAAAAMKGRTCPLVCAENQRVMDGKCVTKVQKARREPAPAERRARPERAERYERAAPEPPRSGGLKLCNVGGRQMAVCD